MLQGRATEIQKKYGTTAFMYTEYPHKRFWEKGYVPEMKPVNPALLYVHIPYCEKLCYFCTCHIEITHNYNKVKDYLELLYKEIALLKDKGFDFKEIHLGGGSPTILDKEEFDELIKRLGTLANLSSLDEFSIEVDPRRVSQAEMQHFADNGINRVSFGVQDFDIEVQKAINREQPVEMIEELIHPRIRKLFKNGVNFDIICGLPKQTVSTMAETCMELSRLKPDRICLNYLHYSPEMAKHQKLMKDLPDFAKRKELFKTALDILTNTAGYVRTGYDHFALPTDANALATESGTVGWNSLGTNPGRVRDTIGIGVSSISAVGDTYHQNFYEIIDYKQAVDSGKLPVYRGYILTWKDKQRREIIHSLRNHFKAKIKYNEIFREEFEELKELEKDGLVRISGTELEVIEPEYTNLVCRVFDEYYKGKRLAPDLGERDVADEIAD